MGKASRKKLLQKQSKQSSEIKLSQALLDLCEPFKVSEEQFKELINLAAIAWNASLLPEEERLQTLMKSVESIPAMKKDLEADLNKMLENGYQEENLSSASIMLQLIAVIIKRKNELYPDDNRSIMDFTVEETSRGYHLSVKALKPNKQSASIQVEM